MKKVIILFLVLSFIFVSCGGDDSTSTKTTQPIKTEKLEEFKPKPETIVEGLEKPTDLAFINDDSYLISETDGDILLFENNQLKSTFLSIKDEIKVESELGLLSILLVPKSNNESLLYFYYGTALDDTFTALDVVEVEGNKVDLSSRQNIFTLPQPYKNHNGGELTLDQNGDLFLGTGDGGSGNDPENRAQNLDNFYGKMLKFNIANKNIDEMADLTPEIWAYGLRNPWRYVIDSKTNQMIIGDVGQNEFEEVNVVSMDSTEQYNFGWRCFEANDEIFEGECNTELVAPVFAYNHDEGCSITAGEVYRGNIKSLKETFIFTDFCSGSLYSMNLDSKEVNKFHETKVPISNFATGPNQDQLLYFDYSKGELISIKQES